MSNLLKAALAMLLLPVVAFSTPSLGVAVLCIGADGHVAIESVCWREGAHDHANAFSLDDAHEVLAKMMRSGLGRHCDKTHDGTCQDYELFGGDHIANRTSSDSHNTCLGATADAPLGLDEAFSIPTSAPPTVRRPPPGTQQRFLSSVVIRC